jgi:hypothetical protein
MGNLMSTYRPSLDDYSAKGDDKGTLGNLHFSSGPLTPCPPAKKCRVCAGRVPKKREVA